MRVILDPGHGGKDPGAVELHGNSLKTQRVFVDPVQPAEDDQLNTVEAELNYDIVYRVKFYLEQDGICVIMTRKAGEFVSLDARAELANRMKADCFVSIHLNAAPNPSAHGYEVFSFPGSKHGALLRDKVLGEIGAQLPDWTNRGGKAANFAVLRETFCPACLVEGGFVTNPAEEKRLNEQAVRDRLARGIAAGVIKFVDSL